MSEAGETNALQPLKDEVRCAVIAGNTGPDQTDSSDMKKILGGCPLRTVGLDQGHTKHPVTLERVLEHLLVTRLKNVKRQ